jgi:hypothetical protein
MECVMSELPVLLVVFNRPDKARRLIEALGEVKPTHLYVAADGPRPDRPEDQERCELTRSVASNVDWPCAVKTRFLKNNLGCGRAVSSAISWFFEHEDRGVILEDDCLPHPHLFSFCSELLDRYADDERVMRIAGFSPYPQRECPYDYHFSRRFYCWGWATWHRAWKHFVYELDALDEEALAEMVRAYFPFYYQRKPCTDTLRRIRSGALKTWAIRWDVACFAQNGLSIVPERNLVTNIGVGEEEATHTKRKNQVFADLKTHPFQFPLRHPPFVYHDGRPERALERLLHQNRPLKNRITYRLRHAGGTVVDFCETVPRERSILHSLGLWSKT